MLTEYNRIVSMMKGLNRGQITITDQLAIASRLIRNRFLYRKIKTVYQVGMLTYLEFRAGHKKTGKISIRSLSSCDSSTAKGAVDKITT